VGRFIPVPQAETVTSLAQAWLVVCRWAGDYAPVPGSEDESGVSGWAWPVYAINRWAVIPVPGSEDEISTHLCNMGSQLQAWWSVPVPGE
jgi:hypothetical protein